MSKKHFSVVATMALAGLAFTPRVQATVIYGIDSASTLWSLDTTGNAGAGAWTKYTMDTTSGSLQGARGIEFDALGNLYVANSSRSSSTNGISKITISGTTATVSNFNTGVAVTGAYDVAIGGSYIYVSDNAGSKRVIRVNLDGSGGGTVIGGTISTTDSTRGIVARGTSVFVNTAGHFIYEITGAASGTPGTATSIASAASGLAGLATDGSNFYATDSSTAGGHLFKGASGTLTSLLTAGAGTALQPVVYADNAVFVGDSSNKRIFEYGTDGTLLATFNNPSSGTFYGLAVVPEPATITLVGLSLLALRIRRRA